MAIVVAVLVSSGLGIIATGSGVTVTAGTIVASTTLQTRLLFPTVNLLRVWLDVQTSLALFARIFTASCPSPKATTPWSASAATGSPAEKNNAWPSPGCY